MRLWLILPIILILGIALATALPPPPQPSARGAVAQTDLPQVSVHPSNITDPALGPSENITIAVNIANVTDLAGFDIQLSWNASLLNYTSHVVEVPVETHPGGVLHEPVMTIKDEVNATAGTYWTAFATLAGPSFNGSGTIFRMNFTIIGFGECALDITNSDLSNSQGSAISHIITNGYFSNAFYDLVILDVVPSPSTVLIGELMNISVVALNNGTTRNETFNVTAYFDTAPIGTETVLGLAPRTQETLQFQWNTSGLSAGDYILSANATTVAGEASTENNRFVNGLVSLIVEPVHDIALNAVVPCKTVVFQGHCLHVNLTLENQGNFAETFNVTLHANNNVIDSAQVHLSQGSLVSVIFAWNTTDAVEYQSYVLNVTVPPVQGENDTGDNSLAYGDLQVVHPGDFDGDMDVDIFDVVMIASAYGSVIGDSEYNSNVDVDCDGEIDILDVVLVTPWYGYQRS